MPPFTVNPHRFDPYKNFKFRIRWDGKYVAGIARASVLTRVTDVIEYREGGDPSASRKSPGRTKYEPITLERGVTHGPEFEQWAGGVWNRTGGAGAEVSLQDFRKDITIGLHNEAGQLVMAWHVYRCWPSVYRALSELDGDAAASAIESLTLVHEGWERDHSITEPVEPSFGT